MAFRSNLGHFCENGIRKSRIMWKRVFVLADVEFYFVFLLLSSWNGANSAFMGVPFFGPALRPSGRPDEGPGLHQQGNRTHSYSSRTAYGQSENSQS